MSTRQVEDSREWGTGPRTDALPGAGAVCRASKEASLVIGEYRTPWGTGSVTVSEGLLVGVELPGASGSGSHPLPTSGKATLIDKAALEHWVGELEGYFRGERLAWRAEDISLDCLGLGAFERSVYTTLLSVPPAVTVSYGVLAEMAGHPRAARAVGNAMAANPVPVVVPCHRVIRSDGSLGNYGHDPAWKERLLAHERTHASMPGRVREGG
ncbi:MAG: methylated-DNA--[protein]-cysteine S-methyltransferase [bacterium]